MDQTGNSFGSNPASLKGKLQTLEVLFPLRSNKSRTSRMSSTTTRRRCRSCAARSLRTDAETAPGSLYGRNRAWLENELSKAHPTHVLRLSTLVGTRIKKNVLFDLKHGLFLDSIDRSAELQWCILNDLPHQIDISLASAPGSRNIVSEPIKNVDIINCFFAHITTGKDSGAVRYNQQPYVYTQAQIFSAMEQYLK